MESYQAELEKLVRGAVTPGARIDVLRLPEAIVAGKGYASAQALEVPMILRSIHRASRAGYDALAIGNGFDPGLWEARELFEVPIVGLFESAALHALRTGWRFGVLCSGNSGPSRIEEMAARYGIKDRMVRPLAIGLSVPQVVSAFDDAEAAEQLMAAARDRAEELANRGADVVVVASGALDVILTTRRLVQFPLPILPSVKILVRDLEAAVRSARLEIPFISRTGRFARPPDEVLQLLDG